MTRSKTMPLFALIWAASVAGAFLMGKKQAPETQPPDKTAAPSTATGNPVPPTREIIRVAGASDATATDGTSRTMNQLVDRKRREADLAGYDPPRIQGPIENVIRDALSDSDPISRMSRFTEALLELTPGNVDAVLEQFKRSGNTGDREFSMFLYAWAKIDGAAAMDYLKSNQRRGWDGMQNAYSAMSGFASVDPAGAEQWARENFEGSDNPYLIGVINGVAKTDLEKATELTYSLPYGRVRGRAVDVLLDGYFKQGDQEVMNWASNLEPGVLKNGIVSRVTGRLSRNDPQLAADFVDTLEPGEERNNASISLADSWARRDPKAASYWASNIPNDEVRGKALEETVEQWARRDTKEIGAFLEAQPDGAYLDGAKREFAERLRFDDPVESLTWAATLENEESRHKLMERIAEEWSERDPEAAAAFLNR